MKSVFLSLVLGFSFLTASCSQYSNGASTSYGAPQAPARSLPPPPVKQVGSPSPSAVPASDDRSVVRSALKEVFVAAFQFDGSASSVDRNTLLPLIDDMTSCGFSITGPLCLNANADLVDEGLSLSKIDGSRIYLADIKPSGVPELALAFTIDQKHPVVSIDKVEIYKVVKGRAEQEIGEYLSDSSQVVPVASLVVSTDLAAYAGPRIAQPRDIKELYHLSQDLFAADSSQAEATKLIANFEQNRSVVSASTDLTYQEALLTFLSDDLRADARARTEIYGDLMHSSDPTMRQFATIAVFQAEPSRDDLRPAVLEAVNSAPPSLRARAIKALNGIHLRRKERAVVLQAIADSDAQVRAQAVAASRGMRLSNEDMPAIEELLKSHGAVVRRQAVVLLGQIGTVESTTQLIAQLGELDEEVAGEIFNQLDHKNLDPSYVPDLAREFKIEDRGTRIAVAKLLGKIKSPVAARELRKQLAVELDAGVISYIEEALKNIGA